MNKLSEKIISDVDGVRADKTKFLFTIDKATYRMTQVQNPRVGITMQITNNADEREKEFAKLVTNKSLKSFRYPIESLEEATKIGLEVTNELSPDTKNENPELFKQVIDPSIDSSKPLYILVHTELTSE
jgi:hypothetical protein